MRSRRRMLVVAALTVLAIVALLALRAIDEPLRQHMEQQLNASLDGYRVGIGALRLHLLGGSLDLLDSTIVQTAHPDPPVARVPRLRPSVHWRALLHGKLVAEFRFDRPVLHITPQQARTEARSTVPLHPRGWQEAAEHIYPFKIDRLMVANGDVTYTPPRPFAPLHLRLVNLIADNVRNVRSRDRTYPSDVHLDAFVFDTTELRVDGNADFLADPYAGIKAYVSAEQLPLWYLTPLIDRWASIQKGVLSIDGTFEYGPHVALVDLDQLALDDVEAWYVRTRANAAEEQRATERGIDAAKKASNNPTMQLRADRARMARSMIGVVNEEGETPYAVFFSSANLSIRDFTNQRSEGPSAVELRGDFMGSGRTLARATFRPQRGSPDFDADIRIEGTDLSAMNDLLRATLGFDVAQGELSVYSEVQVRNAAIHGYVKPIFKGVRVYSGEKDSDKPLGEKVRERIAGGVATVLKNQFRDELATRADLSGPLEGPRTSTLQAILGLVRNAYFRAIRPGLEKARDEPEE